jgi:arylsulfatase A-like enzyme
LVSAAASAAGSGGINAPEQRDKPYLILVSIDGFRWDYQDLYDTPALDRIAASGVRADAMIPVFPTLTFPNHYSIATGLYPANHGLIGNHFPSKDGNSFYSSRNRESVEDGSWYGGEPIWVAAERNKLVSAAYFFVGTEAPVNGIPLTYWHTFSYEPKGVNRVDKVLEWLSMPAEERPHMITLYFEDVDVASHKYGPGSPQSIESIGRVDNYLDRLLSGIDALSVADDVYVVLVSDHGQARRNTEASPFVFGTVANLDGLRIIDHGAVAFIYFPETDRDRAVSIRDAINGAWNHGSAMLRDEMPESWKAFDDSGIADVVVQADPGYLAFSTLERSKGASLGDHGWAPEFEDMFGIFLASGPRLPKGLRVAAINNVDVYPLLMEILELPITTPIDGDPELLPDLMEH